MSEDEHHDHGVDLPEVEDTTALIAAAAAAAAVEAVDVDVHAAVLAVEEAAHKVGVVSNDEHGILDDAEPSQKRIKTDRNQKSESKNHSHEDALAARRVKDRNRYSQMSEEERAAYNQKRREQYHRQNELQRNKRRERERLRYHALDGETAQKRNARRAKLERERYNRLTPQELEERNRLRRERAAAKRAEKEAMKNRATKEDEDETVCHSQDTVIPNLSTVSVDVDIPDETQAYVDLVDV